jgi:hypothetical protein
VKPCEATITGVRFEVGLLPTMRGQIVWSFTVDLGINENALGVFLNRSDAPLTADG